MMKALIRLLTPLASLRLTVFCLAAAMVLVFAGTLAQRQFDIYIVQTQYFQSWLVWWQGSPGGFRFPMFPGGHLIGAVLLVNLLASGVVRYRLTVKKFGILMIHFGLVIMLAGGLVTDLFSVSSFMSLTEGETKNYSEDAQRVELAVTDTSATDLDTVTAIPGALLGKGGTISHESLPFKLIVRGYYQNSKLEMIGGEAASAVPASTQGIGARVSVKAAPPATAVGTRDSMAAVLELQPKDGASLGTWLVSDNFASPQEVMVNGRAWTLHLRPARYYKPYSLTLVDFSHKVYPGSDIPKDFSSHVTLDDPAARDHRAVRIYMNHPLRYQGDTYYQSGTMNQNTGTILQVVRNPGWTTPYLACVVISLGLLWQFLFHLVRFIRRHNPTSSAS